MDPLSGAASVIAVVQLTDRIVQICGKYLNSVRNAKEDIQQFQLEIVALTQVLRSLNELLRGPDGAKLLVTQDLANNIAKCSSALTKLKERIEPETTQRQMRKWGLRALKWPLTRSELEKSADEIQRYTTMFSLALQVDQTRTTNLIDQKIDISRLQTAEGAAFDSYANRHGECLPGTRTDLLQEIEDWTKAPHGKPIYWLNGMAGTGKSTISRTIASRLKEQHLLGASFFFKRGEEDRGTAKRLFSTLVKDLVLNIPGMLPTVLKAIETDPRISEKALREQFEKLLLDPLLADQQGRHEVTSKVIVIDALDECDREDDIELILRLLQQFPQSTSIRIRFFLTSRPDLPIRQSFERIAGMYQDFILQDIPEPVIEHDIALYFEDQFSRIRRERLLPSTWPGEATTKQLIERAVPLFIAAVTLCLFIGDTKWNPRRRLKEILEDRSLYVSRMDSTYTPVLKQILAGQSERETQQLLTEFKEIVGVVVVLATPLSINALSQLLDRELDDVKCRLDQLHSVLNVPDNFDAPIRLLHLSFRDFLLDPENSKSQLWIDEKKVHQYLMTRCLRTMRRRLGKNICCLPSEGTLYRDIDRDSIRHYISPELRYACRYWATHLVQSYTPAKVLIDSFSFLEKHFLHWLEAMSILGFMSEVVMTIKDLELVIQVRLL
ncbi:hypothetical protein ETB97_010035 [Aspergillus alliaceus]|uniref:NACHT domain-containing protein n=1 Tax=Petromyces alliaceus TaxID=209559 RepID=A0A8H5ZRK5_PETAA|nr:hypothetical protein ETB97_010035 [Aspergillus burnettii]